MTFNPSLIQDIGEYDDQFGYHLNVSADLLNEQTLPYRVFPTTPNYVWCGDVGVPYEPETYGTVFLLFADWEEAKAVMAAYWTEPEG